jgi:hypothetical protein
VVFNLFSPMDHFYSLIVSHWQVTRAQLDVREEDISHERGDQNETLLLQAYMYADIFSILRYYHFPCMYNIDIVILLILWTIFLLKPHGTNSLQCYLAILPTVREAKRRRSSIVVVVSLTFITQKDEPTCPKQQHVRRTLCSSVLVRIPVANAILRSLVMKLKFLC